MSTTYRFKSVLNPEKYGFCFESDAFAHWDRCQRTGGLLSYHAFYFETYGDGQTQHAPLCPVSCGLNNDAIAVDWMLSLAQYLNENPGEYHYSLDSLFGCGQLSRAEVQFLDGVKAGQGYYSLSEQKTSKSSSKQHDKRWHAIPSSAMDLSYRIDRIQDLYFVQTDRRFNVLELIGVVLAISEGLDECYISIAQSDKLGKWLSEDMLCAAKALRQTLKARQATKYAGECVSCFIGNLKRAVAVATPEAIAA